MAFTFDSTVGGTSSNSYLSLTEANDYFGGRFGADEWNNFTDVQKKQLLSTATKKLDAFTFGGIKVGRTQALQWPRTALTDADGYPLNGIIPQKLKEATCEMAYWIWSEGDRILSDTEILQVDSYNVGPINVSVNQKRVVLPPTVEALLNSIGPGVLLSTKSKNSNTVSISR
jgi:hypothetical protein